jgi:hypothetical protein
MFASKRIWIEYDSEVDPPAGQRPFTAPELHQARRFGAERDRLLLSIPNGGFD